MGIREHAVGLLLALAACAHAGPDPEPAGLRPPALALQRGPDIEAALGAAEISAALRVANPNSVPIRVRTLDWQLAVGDGPAFRGRLEIDRDIGPRDRAVLELKVQLSLEDAMELNARVRNGETRIRASALLHITSSRGDLAVPAAYSGNLEVLPWDGSRSRR